MPKNTGLKLFTKTWPLKRDRKRKEEDQKRPLTATLDKPTILDVRFIDKIDMSLLKKEFLNMSIICRMPLIIKKETNLNRLLGSKNKNKSKKKKKKVDPSDESHEDDESSVIQSAKLNTYKSACRANLRSSGKLCGNLRRVKENNILAIKNSINDANNNKTSLKVPSRKPTLTTIPAPMATLSCHDSVKSSTKLPSPCRTCGRPDLPERFHSHPATPLKPSPRNYRDIVVLEKVENIVPVKSTVQKPIAIKYQSKNAGSAIQKPSLKKLATPLARHSFKSSPNKENSLKPAAATSTRESSAVSNKSRESDMTGKSTTTSRGGSGKRTLTCYICGREFGTASLPLHEPKCMEKWQRENASLPPSLRRKPPVKPDGVITSKEWNQMAWESSQASLVPCANCGRTFYPDRLAVHQRSCRTQCNINNNNNNNKRASSNDTISSSSSSSMSQGVDLSNSKSTQPPSVKCYICGRMFGTQSIKIHEKQCLKKWHTENESLPIDMRSPAPVKQAGATPQPPPKPTSLSATPSETSSKDDRPASGAKSPLFPCYLCGKLFTVNSIYIHEPQCLKMWKIENDKLPAGKRRPIPMKPDVKFTRSGKINFEETSKDYWQSHLKQLVPCKVCSRTFNPDRVSVHERSCKGN